MNCSLGLVGLLFVVLATTVSASLPGVTSERQPEMGVHTIRADDHLLQVAEAGGFSWMIQLLEWREIEPVPGEHFWEYTDWLVRATEYYELDLVLRLDHPPEWATSPDEAIPLDIAAYARFAGRVAARYRGKITAYVVWNEPNLETEWEGQPPDPDGYVELLCATRVAIHAADPDALVVSAGLAPTNHTDNSALDDRLYLQAIYAAGASGCFDVLGAHPYGFAYPPDDPYGAHDSLNFTRLVDLRGIMVEAGDGDKPLWATELGWTTHAVGTSQQWLQVSEDKQSRYLLGAFERTGQEWPWLERIAVWNLSAGLASGDERRGYSILDDDATPKPAYEALAKMLGKQGDRETGKQKDEGQVEVLARDVVVRLSDVDTFYPHWARPHCGFAPCRRWSGQFYIHEPEAGPWRLHMEVMQVEEPGNLVRINGHPLEPPTIPLRSRPDFASVWTAVEMPVPSNLLQPGVNVIEIAASPRLPVYQEDRARFESLQFRAVQLVSGF
jgi:hypothetical protein